MSANKKTTLLALRIFVDLFSVCVAWNVAYFLRFHTGIVSPKGIPEFALYTKLTPFVGLIWFGVFSAAGFYRRSLGKRSAFLEALDIFQSCFLATLAFIAFTYFYAEYRYSRLGLLIFAVMHPWLIVLGRSLIRKTLRFYRRKAPRRHLLLIGSGEILKQALYLANASDLSLNHILGAVLIGEKQEVEESRKFCKRINIQTFDSPEDWTEFLSKNNVHGVIIGLPHMAYPFLENHLSEITEQVLNVKVVPDIMRYSKFAAGIDIYNGIPIVNIHESPLEGGGSVIKRALDVFGAALGLIFAFPILLVTALLVRITSSGPIFYLQERMGLDGKTFMCIKFRSMPVDAEKASGPVWARSGEQRATKFGSFIRKFSIDELPQLWNVLKGDMSLVGPRPERPVFVDKFRKNVPGYMLRHKAKAGLTGWAQVNGWRGNTSIEKRIEYDLFYIQNWSIWFDLRIMFMTVVEVFMSRNAY